MVSGALPVDRKPLSLRKENTASFFIPGHSDVWKVVPSILSVDGFKPDCASVQFPEDLLILSEACRSHILHHASFMHELMCLVGATRVATLSFPAQLV